MLILRILLMKKENSISAEIKIIVKNILRLKIKIIILDINIFNVINIFFKLIFKIFLNFIFYIILNIKQLLIKNLNIIKMNKINI
jgi:hypothetical protein